LTPVYHFQFCPRCGQRRPPSATAQPFRCAACGFLFFFNPAIAVAVLVMNPDRQALWIRRAKDPGRGKLAMPGGFVDIDETAEAALRRELREEVGLEIRHPEFLCSQPNAYFYHDVTYPVLDLFFIAGAADPSQARALDAVASIEWADPREIPLEELAFPSMQKALVYYRGLTPGAPTLTTPAPHCP
jgi:ADP-ribose pyrophosphatase YjhB (NUDIX family)